MESIILGGGCFWCLDASYNLVNGVVGVTSGYSGGHTEDPDDHLVYTTDTGHAEVVKVDFDPSIISLSDVLDIFWIIHDPTTLNRQSHDVGTLYRSIIFYNNEDQKKIIEASRDKTQPLWKNPIVTQILPLDIFYPAANHHQNFYANNPNVGYCQVIINPKLKKLSEKFAQRLKT